MEQEQLNTILKNHKKWLSGKGGAKADLSYADLSYLNLNGVNLYCANLEGVDLNHADLSGANLNGADIDNADLSYAILSGATLINANLSGTNLSGACLRGTTLKGVIFWGADLRNVDLRGADLCNASLNGAKLMNIKHHVTTSFFALQCPESGSFTAYKKCGNYIVELSIPKSAKRSSATNRKCRANKAKVIAIYNLDRTISELDEVTSDFDEFFIYKIGETLTVRNFDENRWKDCSTGIHFFITFEEAVQY